MPEEGVKCRFYTVISIDPLRVYGNYMQVYLDNCIYKIVNKKTIDVLDDNLFETDEDQFFFILINECYKCCYYDKIDKSEGIDPDKSNDSKECVICHYWFLNRGFKFQHYVCNGSQDFTMLCLNISDIAIITVKAVDYRCIIHGISKSEAIRVLKNPMLDDYGYI